MQQQRSQHAPSILHHRRAPVRSSHNGASLSVTAKKMLHFSRECEHTRTARLACGISEHIQAGSESRRRLLQIERRD